jgi:hypothetical protein
MPISAPRHDLRPGARGASMFRLAVVSLLCALQYWLLTSAMESFQAGHRAVALPAFLASLAAFALNAGLLIAGERGARRAERTLSGERHDR